LCTFARWRDSSCSIEEDSGDFCPARIAATTYMYGGIYLRMNSRDLLEELTAGASASRCRALFGFFGCRCCCF